MPPNPEQSGLLTDAERAWMLDDIASVALTVATRLFADETWDDLDVAHRSLTTHRSPIERLGFISRILPQLVQAGLQIQQSPSTQPLTAVWRVAPPVRARRVTTASLLRAVRQGHAAQWLEDTRMTQSVDTPENRAVLSFVEILRRDAVAIGAMAHAAGEMETMETARRGEARLRNFLAQPFWQNVSRTPAAWRLPPTHRMLAHPAYARLSEWMRLYRRSFAFDWDHPLFSLPAREMWQLYEAWGLFQVLRALRSFGADPLVADAGEACLFAVRQDRLSLRLAKGLRSQIDLRLPAGTRVSLSYNRSYPAGSLSLSRTLQPDITLQNETGEIWLLDPKFKAYAAPGDEGDDIDQMHAYRDAIVTPSGAKPVQRAWCLFAGAPTGPKRPQISYGPADTSIVGALCLRPGDTAGFERLCRLLQNWLGL